MKKIMIVALSIFALANLTTYVYAADTAPAAETTPAATATETVPATAAPAEKPKSATHKKSKSSKKHTTPVKKDKTAETPAADATKADESQGRGLPKAFSNSEGQ